MSDHPHRSAGGHDRAAAEAAAGDAAARVGRLADARTHYAEAVRLRPTESRFHWLLGLCEARAGREERAGPHLQTAARLAPAFAHARVALGNWYLHQGMVGEADAESRRGLELAPADPHALRVRAAVLEAAGDLDAAWALVATLVARRQVTPTVAVLYARMARWRGRSDEAVSLVDRLLADPRLGVGDRYPLHLAAADLLDGLGRYDDAFAHARRGNALAAPPYDPAAHERSFDRLIGYFTRRRLRSIPRPAWRTEKPIFIVGMPRSGTTLVEQVLAAHPAVCGGGEPDFMSHVWAGTVRMLSAAPRDYPDCLDRLTADRADGLAQCYAGPLAAFDGGAARVTDKLPLNFLHLGLIALLLPDARVVHCRRDPLDTCLSCHLTAFRAGHEFKYDLSHLGRFHRQYARLMDHCRAELDLRMLDVSYEQLVADPEPVARQLVAFAGLPWDDACLHAHRTRRGVTTASVQQVRRPIHTASVGRWRHYERHLGPLVAALEATAGLV